MAWGNALELGRPRVGLRHALHRGRASAAGPYDDPVRGVLGSRRSPWQVTEAARRKKPSWYVVATEDRMVPPPAQRAMSARAGATVVEHQGSHAIYVSQSRAVVELIVRAAQGVSAMSESGRATGANR